MRIFGVFLPYIGMRRIPINANGSIVDTGKADILDEAGPYYVRMLTFEWLGFGLPIWQFDGGAARCSRTHKIAEFPAEAGMGRPRPPR